MAIELLITIGFLKFHLTALIGVTRPARGIQYSFNDSLGSLKILTFEWVFL